MAQRVYPASMRWAYHCAVWKRRGGGALRSTAQLAALRECRFSWLSLWPKLYPLRQLFKFAGSVRGAIGQDDFDVQASAGYQFGSLLYRGGYGVTVQRDDAGRIVRGNVEFHNAPAFERHSF